MTDLKTILIWVAVIGAAFAILWWQGQLKRLAAYVTETREELKKCTWPSWDELKGSTVVVMITIAILGAFTVVVDRGLFFVFFKIL
ncbi:MAG: preprotein translocase subunit SecE [Pedosphaera sp.]|nr:preprotein translocase subunit SecE [Pedosphaera sp.]